MRKFDSKKCINNIYYLIKDRNMKIGDVEKEVGVSTGYFSRLSKEDNQASPSMETLCALAELLGVSLDSLAFLDLTEMGYQDRLVSDFILKVIEMTVASNLLWTKQDMANVEVDISNFNKHPLFELRNKEDEGFDSNIHHFDYTTTFRKGGYIVGEFYTVYLEDYKASLYIVKTAQKHFADLIGDDFKYVNESYELFMSSDNELNGICHTDSLLGKFYEKILPQLYDAAAVSSRKSKINIKVKNIITKFMNDNK